MEYNALPIEWANEPKNDELAQKILTFLAEAKTKNDLEGWRQATLLLVETYLAIDQAEEAADLIRGTLEQNVFEDFKTILELSDKLVQILVKSEDFEQLSSALDYRDRFVDQSPSQKVMQQFYRAVCFEGLKKYDQAIDTLHAIPDTMSNAKLVSKYLKLAMLNLQIRDYPNALMALRRAELFDKTHSNEMFGIVESDLAFYSGDYQAALAKFEAFFIKSAFKNRYLDRYIRINVKLGRYDDAWHFFQKYEPKMAKNASRYYRYQFYDAAILLADAMNNRETAQLIKEKMLGLYESKARFVDQFDGVKNLLDAASKRVVYQTQREVVLDVFRQLTSIVSFGRLQYIEATPDGIRVGQFSKGLMLDKTYPKQSIQGTILAHIVQDAAEFALYRDNELANVTDYLDFKPFQDTGFVSVQTFTVGVKPTFFGKVAAYLEQDAHFDYYNKLLMVARDILSIKLEYFRLHAEKSRMVKMLSDYFVRKHIGIAKIADGFLYLENPEAMELLGIDRDVIPFETFQSLLMTSKPFYLDEFAVKSHLELRLKRLDKEVVIAIESFVSDQIIRLFLSDITISSDEIISLRERIDTSKYPGISSYARLVGEYAANKKAPTLILMKIILNSTWQNPLPMKGADSVLLGLSELLIQCGNKHVTALYAAEDYEWLVGFDTTDRRAIERMATDVTEIITDLSKKQLGGVSSWTIRYTSLSTDNDLTLPAILDELRFALSLTDPIHPYVPFDRTASIQYQLAKTLSEQFRTQFGKDPVSLRYRPFGRISSRKIAFYLAEPFDVYRQSSETIQMALRYGNLSSVYQNELIKALFADAIRYREANHTPHFSIVIDEDFLLDSELEKRLSALLRKDKKIPTSLILMIQSSSLTGSEAWNSAVELIRSKGFAIGLIVHSSMTLLQCETLKQYDYVMVDSFTEARFLKPFSINNRVVDHVSHELANNEALSETIIGGEIASNAKTLDELLSTKGSTVD